MIKNNRHHCLQPAAVRDCASFWLAGGRRAVGACGNSHDYGRERRHWRSGQTGRRWRLGHGHGHVKRSVQLRHGDRGQRWHWWRRAALIYPPGAGGHGGAASSTATASNTNGPASATATSTGGNGGRGGLPNPCIHTCIPGAGGGGGVASAISSATGGGRRYGHERRDGLGWRSCIRLQQPRGWHRIR